MNGDLFNGLVISVGPAVLDYTNISAGTVSAFTFPSGSPAPLDCATGSSATGRDEQVLLTSATDAQGVTHIYSLAYTHTSGSGGPNYDGYVVRDYDSSGNWLGDHSIGVSSEQISGVLADGSFLYLIAYPSGTPTNGAHVIKISTDDWQIVNEWSLNQANSGALSGCYDPTNDCFWLGSVNQNLIYQYRGSGGTTNPNFAANPGFDLRDNPNPLYYTTSASGAQSRGWTSYDFKVVPFTNSGGPSSNAVSTESLPSPVAAYEVAATLDNRTYSSGEDPQHTTADLGSWDANDVSARLDLGALQVDATDLAVNTYGPPAQISRTYLASNSGARFAPGWDFNFDQHLDISQIGSNAITYYDACGDAHQFAYNGSSWLSPGGFLGTLSYNSSQSVWQITYPDGTTDTYTPSGTTGVWSSESDRNGNTTTYAWSGNNLTITAANGQTIAVSCNSSGQIAKATYTTSAGTREVDYTTASPWQVSYYPSSADARTVEYDYASGPLSAIDQLNWPSTGNTATESFAYSSGNLSGVYFPDYNATSKPDARLTIAYASSNGTASATICHYGTVGGVANQPTEQQTDSWSTVAGVPAVEESQVDTSANTNETSTTDYSYAANNQLADSVTLANTQSNETTQDVSASNPAGDVTAQSNSSGVGMQTLAYTDSANLNLPTSVTDPLGTTTNTYDSHGNLTQTQRTLNANGDVSCTKNSYNSQGLTTEQQQLVSGTPSNNPTWIETDYGSFYANGSPGTTTVDGVQLSPGGSTSNLTETATYDPFGDLLTQTDWSNSRVTATDTYDVAGNQLSSTDAYGITTNNQYDCLGNLSFELEERLRVPERRLDGDDLRSDGSRPDRHHQALRRLRQPHHPGCHDQHLGRRGQRAVFCLEHAGRFRSVGRLELRRPGPRHRKLGGWRLQQQRCRPRHAGQLRRPGQRPERDCAGRQRLNDLHLQPRRLACLSEQPRRQLRGLQLRPERQQDRPERAAERLQRKQPGRGHHQLHLRLRQPPDKYHRAQQLRHHRKLRRALASDRRPGLGYLRSCDQHDLQQLGLGAAEGR